MKHCPKCRSFYDDEHLRFCLKDGIPLVDVNQSDEIWDEGTNFIRETRRLVTRETRIQRVKKIVSMAITTILVIMVVSVIILKSWIYLYEPDKKIEQSDEQKNSLTTMPSPKTTSSVTTNTATSSVTTVESPKSPQCSDPAIQVEIKQKARDQYEKDSKHHEQVWRKGFESSKTLFLKRNGDQIVTVCKTKNDNNQACDESPSFNAILKEGVVGKPEFTVKEDCRVSVEVTYEWIFSRPDKIKLPFEIPQKKPFPFQIR